MSWELMGTSYDMNGHCMCSMPYSCCLLSVCSRGGILGSLVLRTLGVVMIPEPGVISSWAMGTPSRTNGWLDRESKSPESSPDIVQRGYEGPWCAATLSFWSIRVLLLVFTLQAKNLYVNHRLDLVIDLM
jgi:hypothetical protein